MCHALALKDEEDAIAKLSNVTKFNSKFESKQNNNAKILDTPELAPLYIMGSGLFAASSSFLPPHSVTKR